MKKKRKLNGKQKALLSFSFVVFLLVILIVFASLTAYIDTIIYSPEIKKSLIYNEVGSFNHSVCLKDNEYINDSCITEKRSFVTSLINNIKLEFKYQLDSSDLIDYSYDYVITAIASANEKGESTKVLYNKEEVLKKAKKKSDDTNLVLIDEKIDLDYQKYNDIITSFKKNYVLAVDSELLIKVTFNIHGENKGIDEKINNTYTMSISMPLAEQTVNIKETNNNISNSNSILKYKDKSVGYKKYHIMADILYKLDIAYLLFIIYIGFALVPRKKQYDLLVSRILKNYDDLIVSVKKMPEIRNLNLIEVEKFDELLTVRETLNRPIIYFETIHKDCSAFVITTDNDAYLYTITAYKKVNHENHK